jgi:phytoene synthase
VSSQVDLLAGAYAVCNALARSHYENFPVASRLLPSKMRPHVLAVYAFARVADDIADEGVVPASTRLARLGEWQRRLREAVAETSRAAVVADGRDDLIIVAVAHTIRSLELPVSLFDDLISAFGQDTTTTRYASWSDVLDYCRRSANPVGRLVLRIAGYRDVALDRSSDALCTALQLTNFWQDFGRDWRAGRLYVPCEVVHACGAEEADLHASRLTHEWGLALQACVERTSALFDQGRAICDAMHGRLRAELRLTWLGGRHILDQVERARFALLDHRPAIRRSDLLRLGWRALRWRVVGDKS